MRTLIFGFAFLGSILFSLIHAQEGQSTEKPFVVVVASYNNRDWFQDNLNSVFNQKYQNYRVIYIADASTDRTAELVEEFVRQHHQEHRFTLIKHQMKGSALACLTEGVYLCDEHEIVVDLDGNDWLAHDGVLASLNSLYSDPDVWMTYGQFAAYPRFTRGFAKPIPEEVVEQNNFRSFGGAVTHLRTFYAGLFQRIAKEDLLFEGKFIQRSGDLAYSIPILEMAGRHVRFVPDVLYIYNRTQPLNDHKVSDALEEAMDRFVRSKEKYAPLSELSFKDAAGTVYSQIADIYHPTFQDYLLVQDFLSHGDRLNLERLNDMYNGPKNMKIIGKSPDEFPRSGVVHVNSHPEERENCVLIYSTFNRSYPAGLKRLLKLVSESDFKGHVLYRMGGWPNTEGGDLNLAHVPYAFKVSFFREAQRLGYKRVLWLDTSVVPLVSVNEIFSMIEEQGYFVMGNSHTVGPYMNSSAAAFFGFNLQQTFKIPSCSAGLFGVDFTQDTGRRIIDWWYRAAHDKDAFFSARSDQSALSMIFYRLGLSNLISLDRMPHSQGEIKSDSLFWLDREFVFGMR